MFSLNSEVNADGITNTLYLFTDNLFKDFLSGWVCKEFIKLWTGKDLGQSGRSLIL